MIIAKARRGLSAEAMHSHLAEVHGPLVMSKSDVSGEFRRYVHHYANDQAQDPLDPGEPHEANALTIICFDNMQAFMNSTSNEAYRNCIAPDENNFRDLEGSLFAVAQEFILREESKEGELRLFHFRTPIEGIDPAEASQAWRERLAAIFAQHSTGGAVSRYVHNLVARPNGEALHHTMIDEIWLSGGGEDLAYIGQALRQAETGLIENTLTRTMVTRANTFIEG